MYLDDSGLEAFPIASEGLRWRMKNAKHESIKKKGVLKKTVQGKRCT